jgi:glycosyl transferase family 87
LRVRPWQVAVTTVAIAVLWVLAQSQVAELRSGRPLQREFMAFYTVGYVLNRSPEALYDPDAFNRTYHALFPAAQADIRQLYGHAPFEAIVFRPFALLPFERALVAWQVLSLVLISAGFSLVWRSSGWPWRRLPLPLLLALSFQPVAVACLARGQVSALTFFWIALAIWCQRRGRHCWSGAALAMCLAKPTLLVLMLPMLIVGRRRRALIGFTVAAGILLAVSLLVVGWRGCAGYAVVVLRFGGLATTAANSFLLSDYVDINSFLRMATGGRGRLALAGLALAAAAVLPCLAKVWRDTRKGDPVELGLAWASTLTWTTVLNLYVPAYDTPIILLGIVLGADELYRANRHALPLVLRILFVLLYVVPWIPPVPVGDSRIVQLYTLVLVALGVYQVWVAMRGIGGAAGDQGRSGVGSGRKPLAGSHAV